MNKVLFGDCRDHLRYLDIFHEKPQMCVTSPPYWGLRDYGNEPLLWGDGWKGSLGLEPTPEMYVGHIVEVFHLVYNVLRDDGTLWLNIGDTYATGAGRVGKCPGGTMRKDKFLENFGIRTPGSNPGMFGITQPNRMPIKGYQPKDLVGIPWMVAFAMREHGWIIRQEIIWNKTNVMPESVRDRCTRSHEQLFMFVKRRRYYYDYEAIKERTTGNAHDRGSGVHPKAKKIPDNWDTTTGEGGHGRFKNEGKHSRIHTVRDVQHANRTIHANRSFSAAVTKTVEFRNKRSVWNVPSSSYKGGHYSTFPANLITPCILAGSRKGDIVLDPFFGSGTTGEVCEKLGRRYIGMELNRGFEPMIQERIAKGAMG